jgi:hypothetical protein
VAVQAVQATDHQQVAQLQQLQLRLLLLATLEVQGTVQAGVSATSIPLQRWTQTRS